jgi:NitT/TauT family transport system substrate-binding protein
VRLSRNLLRAGALTTALLIAFALAPRLAWAADDPLVLVNANYPPSVADLEDTLAQVAGFYKEEHLAVTEQYVANAAASFAVCSSGHADVCSADFDPLVRGYSKGLRLELFLAHHPIYDYTLAVLADSPIKTLADFKGANIGETTAGNGSETATNAELAGAGLHKSDYGYTPIGVGAGALAAIMSHRVDAVSFPMQELAMFHASTGVNFRMYTNPLLRDVQNSGAAASPEILATKPDLLRRYARAVVKAFILVRVNPMVSARMYLEGTHQAVTPERLTTIYNEILALEPMYPAYDLSDPRIGYMSVRGLKLYCKFVQDAGLTPALVPGDELVTNQFIAFANDFDKKAFIKKVRAWK